ncbi:hypothetical protein AYL99_12014 [Fonsecaea erecta]|uniref:Uncharacterized protein n=1 Tax=Fonsecaea erecta TaxID=1367422 RepID=A0A178Z3X0_9EURO|nr:hypothetical protein AYL99_12014 [Fonsecaea erecta]OAP53795.1 hypothetical protein AYL99_12014 [Fonsecaea erecta]
MRVHDLSYEPAPILSSPVRALKPDLASRGLRKSSLTEEIHITKAEQAVDGQDVDKENPTPARTTSTESLPWNASRKDGGFSSDSEDEGFTAEDPVDERLPKTLFDHVTPSDSDISNLGFRALAGREEGALQLAKPGLEIVVPGRYIPYGQSTPKSIPLSQASSKTRTRALSKVENPSSKRKRGRPSTMVRTITKRRSWQASRATVRAGVSSSDSSYDDTSDVDTVADVRKRPRARQLPKMSQVRTGSKWRGPRRDRASSAGIGSHPTADPEGRDGRALPQSSDVAQGHGASAAYTTPLEPRCNVHAAASTESAVLTGVLADIASIEPLLKSSAAWGLAGDPSSTRLVSATIKPYTGEQWQLTATFARVPGGEKSLAELGCHANDYCASDSDDQSGSLFSLHHKSSEDESSEAEFGNLTPPMGRRLWREDEDKRLIRLMRRGERWHWVVKQFPGRTEGSIKNHWYAKLAPRQVRRWTRDK